MRSRYPLAAVIDTRDRDREALLLFLEELSTRLSRRGVLIATSDDYVLFMSRNRARLEGCYAFTLAQASTLEFLADKFNQYLLAQQVGVRAPRTQKADPLNIEAVEGEISYPCIVKPAYSHVWHQHLLDTTSLGLAKAVEVRGRTALREVCEQMRARGALPLVQEIVAGGEDQLYGLHAYLDRDSQPLATFVRRKIRQWPPNYGTGCYSVSVHEPRVVELGLALLRRLNYCGIANIEFKRHVDSGSFTLIEINMRGGAQTALTVKAGIDLSHIAYRDAVGEPMRRIECYQSGVRWIDWGSDAGAFLHWRREGQLGFGRWLASTVAARAYAYFDPRDPLPFVLRVAHTPNLARKFLLKAE